MNVKVNICILGIFVCLLVSPRICDAQSIKVATFNTSLFRSGPGELIRELATGESKSAQKVAEILQSVRPDLVLLNEFDFDREGKSVELFKTKYLAVGQNGKKALRFDYSFAPPVNTGVPSGLDLDNDGKSDGPGDAFGFGKYSGQYGFVVLSRFPIDEKQTRTFQKFLWKDMPEAMLPVNADQTGFYSKAELDVFRLSSKNHCDVVVRTDQGELHFLVSHPTPPVFDGEEDRNGRRNHDEIRFWNDYVTPAKGKYIYDDRGTRGGMANKARFVVAGDLNADPKDGDSTNNPIGLFQRNDLFNFEIKPKSRGAVSAAQKGTANKKHQGDPAMDTADFNDNTVGNLRIDYVLPSANLKTTGAGVFWPTKDQPGFDLVGVSDHRLVWIEVRMR